MLGSRQSGYKMTPVSPLVNSKNQSEPVLNAFFNFTKYSKI